MHVYGTLHIKLHMYLIVFKLYSFFLISVKNMWSTIEQRDIDVLWKHSIKGKITLMIQLFADKRSYHPQTSGVRKIYNEPLQSQNPEWFKYRAILITASQMHRILKYS